MLFSDLEGIYLRKIGQSSDTAREESDDHEDRLSEAYWRYLEITGLTYHGPANLTLAAVTATTNQHNLITALGLTTGYNLFRLHRVYWEDRRFPLLEWNQNAIDHANQYSDAAADPLAFAQFSLYDSASHDKIPYASFYPFVATTITSGLRASYFERPPKPTSTTWSTAYLEMPEEDQFQVAELAAVEYLKDRGDARYTTRREQDCWGKIIGTKDRMTVQITKGELLIAPLNGIGRRRYYGETL